MAVESVRFVHPDSGVSDLDLSSGSVWFLMALDFGVAESRNEMVAGAFGSSPVGRGEFENRTVEITVRAASPFASMDAQVEAVGKISRMVEDAARIASDGPVNPDKFVKLTYQAAGASATHAGSLLVVGGMVNDPPKTVEGDDAGWFQLVPQISLTLVCEPAFYGAKVTGPNQVSSAAQQEVTLSSVPGDVAAETEVTVTDLASKERRYVEVGLGSDTSSPLRVGAAQMVVAGYAGTYSGGVVRGTAVEDALVLCATPTMVATGSFRLRGHGYQSESARIRVRYQVGDGPWVLACNWTGVPSLGTFERDLGEVHAAGSWRAEIEMMGASSAYVNSLTLIPSDQWAVVRAPTGKMRALTLSVADDFPTQRASLNGSPIGTGGSWVTTGAPQDFVIPSGGGHVKRTKTLDSVDRFALAGTTTFGAVTVSADLKITSGTGLSRSRMAVLGRWTSTNSWLSAGFTYASGYGWFPSVIWMDNGIPMTLHSDWSRNQYYWALGMNLAGARVELSVSKEGDWACRWFLIQSAGTVVLVHSASGRADEHFGTGAKLPATGRVGLQDRHMKSNALTRQYHRFRAMKNASPPAPVVPKGGTVILGSRYAMSGTSEPGSYVGARPTLPPAGPAGRSSRLVVASREQDIVTGPSSASGANQRVQVSYWPKYLTVPK